MTITNGYTDRNTAKTHMRLSATESDTLIDVCVTAASRLIDSYCGVNPGAFTAAGTATARTYEASGPYWCPTDWFYSTSGFAVATDADADQTFETSFASTDYQLEPANASARGMPYYGVRVYQNQTFPTYRHLRLVQVTALWGYAASIPDAVEEACLIETARMFQRRSAVFGSNDTPDYSGVVMRTRLDAHSELLLSPYRRTFAGVAV